MLTDLLQQARARNARQHVTGMLVYTNATFLQVLEGAEADVAQIFSSIEADPRHTGVIKLREEAIEKRAFPDWHMGFKHIDTEQAAHLPGYVELFGEGKDPAAIRRHAGELTDLILGFAESL
jgi:hypothetical protein